MAKLVELGGAELGNAREKPQAQVLGADLV
jgi:hypothetical protein